MFLQTLLQVLGRSGTPGRFYSSSPTLLVVDWLDSIAYSSLNKKPIYVGPPLILTSRIVRTQNTSSTQAAKARQLAKLHSSGGLPAKKAWARAPRPQDFFSQTAIVVLQSVEEVVIQFRPEPLDIRPFEVACRALGVAVVSEVKVN